MDRTCPAYQHRFRPPIWGLKIGRGIKYTVRFDESCRYNLLGRDQDDWNKLFGVTPFTWRVVAESFVQLAKKLFPKWFDWLKAPQHKHSDRFVWRYNQNIDLIELGGYVYRKGVRYVQKLGEVEFNKDYDLYIAQHEKICWIMNGQILGKSDGKLPWLAIKLGPYFGGNRTTPHQMKIGMK